jgi:cell pole-organizing protein PopZ
MSDNSNQNDPSMKEILGSIRRIISEDNAQTDTQDAGTGEDDETLELTDEVIGEVSDIDRHEPVLVTAHTLSSNALDEPEIRREPILGLHSPEETETDAAHSEESVVDIPELVSQEPPVLPDADQLSATAPELVQDTEPTSDDVVEESELILDEEIAEVTEPPLTEDPANAPDLEITEKSVDELVSATATSAAASALGELTRAMDEKTNKLRVGSGEATISDMVKEMIRPMLREWLDENLSGIVERVVRREIQKLVDRAEPDD